LRRPRIVVSPCQDRADRVLKMRPGRLGVGRGRVIGRVLTNEVLSVALDTFFKELAQNGARRGQVPGSSGGARRALCAF
jgi:hypothetical protein